VALTSGAGRPQVGRLLKVDRQCFRCGKSSQAGPEAELRVQCTRPIHDLDLSVTRAIQAGPHDQATRCRGNIEDLHTLVPAAGALAASGIRSALMTANILDSESKISPLSSPLGTSPESWKP
jgi:hypothetical protein